MSENITEIKVLDHGPNAVTGKLVIIHPDGCKEEKEGTVYLCRCGGSEKKPYCDSTHKKIGF